jgi:hypothetical protein
MRAARGGQHDAWNSAAAGAPAGAGLVGLHGERAPLPGAARAVLPGAGLARVRRLAV